MYTSVFQLSTTVRGEQKATKKKAVLADFYLPVAISMSPTTWPRKSGFIQQNKWYQGSDTSRGGFTLN